MKKHLPFFFKKIFPGMLISYALLAFLLSRLIAPQMQLLEKYREEKNRIEYDYLRLKDSPTFVAQTQQTVLEVKETLDGFEWLRKGYDSNLLFFQKITQDAEKAGALFLQFERTAQKEDPKYFSWKINFQGEFKNLSNLARILEESPYYLRIEEISLQPREGLPLFTVTILGIRNLE